MITTFRTLFTITVNHSYYSDVCRDFYFSVPVDTAALLRNGKLIAKMRDGKLNLLYEADEGGAALVPIAGAKLRFGMKLLNPQFSNFTDFAVPTTLYRNTISPGSLDPAITMGYSDPEFLQEGVFGVVEIEINSAFYSSRASFTISFNARAETLKYYVVVSNYTATEFNHLSVTDNGFTEDGRLRIDFTRVASDAFTSSEIAPEMLAQAGEKVVLFKSHTAVARREKAPSKIQLSKNGDILIKHLPQAGAGRAGGDVVIHISKP
jgi:hypothetical protein